MTRKIVPSDSILNLWLNHYCITEVPVSYQIICGLAAIGVNLKRNAWVDDDSMFTFPNMSVLLIGPSGIGKDVIIGGVESLVRDIEYVPLVAGRTIEYVKSELLKCGDPACCFTPAAELTAFLGGKDYQKGMVNELTDLLTTKDSCDVGSKSEGRQSIPKPTVTVLAGSTAAWLHRSMPDGSLEGGFLPRFVIVCEDYGTKHVPWVKYSNSLPDRLAAKQGKLDFIRILRSMVADFAGRPREIVPTEDARDFYTNWYINRFNYFNPIVKPYANRSRGMLHKVAMLMAISRGHNYLEDVDYVFGAEVINHVAAAIQTALKPQKAR